MGLERNPIDTIIVPTMHRVAVNKYIHWSGARGYLLKTQSAGRTPASVYRPGKMDLDFGLTVGKPISILKKINAYLEQQ